MDLVVGHELKRVLRAPNGEALLRATHEFVSKTKQNEEAIEILAERGFSPETMPAPRPPEVVKEERQRLAALLDDHEGAEWESVGLYNWPIDWDSNREAEINRLEGRKQLDWAIAHVTDADELARLGAEAQGLHGAMHLPFSFREITQLVERDLESLSRKLAELDVSKGIGWDLGPSR